MELSSYLYVQEKSGRDTVYEKMLIQFDLTNAKPFIVKSASMYIFSGNESSPIDIHTMKVDWIDSQANAAYRKTGITWASNYLRSSTDVDYYGIPIVDNFDPAHRAWNTVDITNTFNNWVTGTVSNNGLLMTYVSLLNITEFHSKEGSNKPYILVQYYDTYESRLGDYPQNNTAWMISADYLRGEVHGDVSNATITDPSAKFPDDRILQILYGLDGRLSVIEDGDGEAPSESFHVIGDMYGTAEIFSATETQWRINFPPGKRLKPDGTFLLFIGGLSFSSTAKVIDGYGFQDSGIQVRLNDEWYWRAGTDARGLFQLVDAPYWDAADGLTGEETTTPKHTTCDLLSYSVVGL